MAEPNTEYVRRLIAEYDSPEPFDSAMGAADFLAELVSHVRPLVSTEHVEFDWSLRWGRCYECGLPAAFRLTGHPAYDDKPDHEAWKRCAVCAANAAAEGEFILRIMDSRPASGPDDDDDPD